MVNATQWLLEIVWADQKSTQLVVISFSSPDCLTTGLSHILNPWFCGAKQSLSLLCIAGTHNTIFYSHIEAAI